MEDEISATRMIANPVGEPAAQAGVSQRRPRRFCSLSCEGLHFCRGVYPGDRHGRGVRRGDKAAFMPVKSAWA
ncbi:hypothetical protein, partial [Zoogloea sp.]|uniref:hypothetical protein n=1 Tax=Zoogloea sp. TaxID=49181 RepID=UPI0035B05609